MVAALTLAGCARHNSSLAPPDRAFTVTLKGTALRGHTTYVIVHERNTGAPISYQWRVGEGTLEFADPGRDRITLTFASNTGYMVSYMDVAVGDWVFDAGNGTVAATDSTGRIELTVTFPAVPPDLSWYQLIGSDQRNLWLTYDSDSVPTTHLWNLDSRWLDDNRKVSILSFLQSDTVRYVGWTLDQPYEPGAVNRYSISLDHRDEKAELHVSLPIQLQTVEVLRNNRADAYPIVERDNPGGIYPRLSFSLWKAMGFPKEEYHVSGMGGWYPENFNVDWWMNDLQADLAVPDASVNGIYDSALPGFTHLSVEGEADCIAMVWSGDNGWNFFDWAVFAAPQYRAVFRPTLPDSVVSALHYDSSILSGDWLELEDSDQAHGWEDFVRSARIAEWGKYDCNRLYRYARQYQGFEQTAPPNTVRRSLPGRG